MQPQQKPSYFRLKKELAQNYLQDRYAQQTASGDDVKKFILIISAFVLVQAIIDFTQRKRKFQLVLIILFSTLILCVLMLLIHRIKIKFQKMKHWHLEVFFLVIITLAMAGMIVMPILSDPYSSSGLFQGGLHLGLDILVLISFVTYYNARWVFSIIMITLMWGGIVFIMLYVDGFQASEDTVPLIKGYVMMILIIFYHEKCLRNNFERRSVLSENQISFKQILQQLNETIIVVNRQLDVKYCNGKVFLGDSINSSPATVSSQIPGPIMRKPSFYTADKTFVDTVVRLELHQTRLINEKCPAICQRFKGLHNLRNLIELLSEDTECFNELSEMKSIGCNGAVLEENRSTLKEYYEIHISCAVIDDQECVVIIMTNIFESIRRLKETNEMQKNILSALSHELQTPLNTATNCLEAASKHHAIDEVVKDTLIVPSLINCKLLESFICDVLDFVQMKTGDFIPKIEKVRLLPCVNDCVSLFSNSLKKKNLKFRIDCPFRQNCEISTDFRRLKQILTKLLGNAVKYTFNGEIKLSIQQMSHRLLFTLKDDGIGMNKAEFDNLISNLRNTKIGNKVGNQSTGAGLGLIVANELAKELNPGTRQGLKFVSAKGTGTQVSFEIEDQRPVFSDVPDDRSENYPFLNEDISTSIQPVPSTRIFKSKNEMSSPFQSPKRECGNKPRILVVDDDGFNIHTIETVLGSLGFQCDTAFNGKIALECIDKRSHEVCCENCRGYDLILMDFNMPVMDGLEATRLIRSKISDKEWRETVIVGCTAYVGEEKKKEGLDSGMNDCINKPVTKVKIEKIVANIVSRNLERRYAQMFQCKN